MDALKPLLLVLCLRHFLVLVHRRLNFDCETAYPVLGSLHSKEWLSRRFLMELWTWIRQFLPSPKSIYWFVIWNQRIWTQCGLTYQRASGDTVRWLKGIFCTRWSHWWSNKPTTNIPKIELLQLSKVTLSLRQESYSITSTRLILPAPLSPLPFPLP